MERLIAVSPQIDGLNVVVSAHPKGLNKTIDLIGSGELLYKSTALTPAGPGAPKQPAYAARLDANITPNLDTSEPRFPVTRMPDGRLRVRGRPGDIRNALTATGLDIKSGG